jgi:glyoxylase-like metal-dependent hydrolase (beta-lactamase superfamily II)
MMKGIRHLAVALTPLLSSGAEAQIADSLARVERIAEGVYAIVHEDALQTWPHLGTDWPHSNTGIVVGDDGVLVIDATFLPSRAAADIALIRRLTNKPVRYLVNTHWHGDHTHGNGVYRDSFPGIRIISSRVNRNYIEINQTRFRSRSQQDSYPSRGVLARLESLQQSGIEDGRPLTPEQRTNLQRLIGQRRLDIADMGRVATSPPDSVFDGRIAIELGGRRVELRDHGHANSPSDVTVFLPADRVLFTGDIVVHPVPYAFASYPTFWVPVLRDLEGMSPNVVVPGHGPVMRDLGYVRQVRTLLETMLTMSAPYVGRGVTADSARKILDLTALRRRFDPQLSPRLGEMWNASIVDALVLRTFQCLQGVTC